MLHERNTHSTNANVQKSISNVVDNGNDPYSNRKSSTSTDASSLSSSKLS